MPKIEQYSDRLLLEQIKSHKLLIAEFENKEGSEDQHAEAKGWLEVLNAEKERRNIK